MPESYVQKLFAERIGGKNFGKNTDIYKFEKIKIAKRMALADFPDMKLLDFGVGEPDKRPADAICNELFRWAQKLSKHGYTDTGTDDFRKAIVKYMDKYFGVSGLDFKKNILPTIGSKEALANFPKCMINPGDIALMTVPGYPILGTNTEYLGGKVYNLPLLPENDFFPVLDNIPANIVKRAKILYLNYPNNPTGKCATEEFYRKVIDFAKKNNIIVVQDAPYINIVFDRKPLSILSVPGGMDVAIELHSFSKSYSMTGWRLGFAAGNELLISALATVKDNTDSGSFEAIQKVGIYAMEHADMNEEINRLYKRRLELLVKTMQNIGLDAKMPEGTFYLFMKIPKGAEGKFADGKGNNNKDEINNFEVEFRTAEKFTKFLIERYGIVTVPWDDNNQHFVRFSATFSAKDADDENEQMKELENRLADVEFIL